MHRALMRRSRLAWKMAASKGSKQRGHSSASGASRVTSRRVLVSFLAGGGAPRDAVVAFFGVATPLALSWLRFSIAATPTPVAGQGGRWAGERFDVGKGG
jgi:hypothetical protein